MLGARSAPSVPRERYSCEIVTIQFQQPQNRVCNSQCWNEIPQSYCMTSSLIICHILCLHGWRSCKYLFNTFPWNSSSCHHKDIPRSGFLIIHITCIIGVTETNHLKSVGTSICQHEILGTLKIPQDFLSRFPMVLSRIAQVSTKHTNNKCNIMMCAYLSIHQATNKRSIRDCFYLISLNIISRTLGLGELVAFHNWCFYRRTRLHIELLQDTITVGALRQPENTIGPIAKKLYAQNIRCFPKILYVKMAKQQLFYLK